METCANCGAPLPDDAAACRACGSDAETGWSEETYLDNLDLPEREDEVASEPDAGGSSAARPATRLIVLALLAAFAASLLGSLIWRLRLELLFLGGFLLLLAAAVFFLPRAWSRGRRGH